MRRLHLCALLPWKRFAVFVPQAVLDGQAEAASRLEHQSIRDGARDGVFAKVSELRARQRDLVGHGVLQECARAAILLGQLLLRRGELQNRLVFLQPRGHGLQPLSVLFADDRRAALLRQLQPDDRVLHASRLQQRKAVLRQLRLHAHRQPDDVLISGVLRQILQRHFARPALAEAALRAELPALLQELLDEQEPAQRVVLAGEGNERIRHEQVLAALFANLLLRVLHAQPSQRRVGIFAGAAVLCAIGDVLRGDIEPLEHRLAHGFPGGAEPVQVERAAVQLVLGQRRKAGDGGLARLAEILVHMGDEVVGRGIEAGNSQMPADQLDPRRGVHRHLVQPLVRNLMLPQRGVQGVRIVLRRGNAHAQQMAQALGPAESNSRPADCARDAPSPARPGFFPATSRPECTRRPESRRNRGRRFRRAAARCPAARTAPSHRANTRAAAAPDPLR